MNIRFCGFGGQGILLSGYIYGTAAVIDDNKVLQTQSYGSESRGGNCRSDVIISKEEIYDLAPSCFDVLVALSQPAYNTYLPGLKEEGTLIVEDDLVNTGNQAVQKTFGIKAVEIAYKKFEQKIMANMVMMGFLCGTVRAVSRESLKDAILYVIPGPSARLNLEAFEEGYRLGKKESL